METAAVFILGMGRSGTSALARVLSSAVAHCRPKSCRRTRPIRRDTGSRRRPSELTMPFCSPTVRHGSTRASNSRARLISAPPRERPSFIG